MKIFELIVIGFGLAMDAFAVAVCKGLSMEEMDYKNALVTGGFFGGFQALMPFVGYILCIQFSVYIKALDHWIAFILLFIIGIKKIKESRDNSCPMSEEAFSLKNMLVLSIATSIDALAIGITFSTSCIGVKLGYDLGCKFKSKAEVLGGLILIVVGTKILLEHLGIMG